MFEVTPYAFQPLFHRFVSLWICVQYVTDCMTVVFSFLCCGCCDPPQISLSTCSAEIVDLNDIKNDDQILSMPLNDVSMASGEPSGNPDVTIDIIPPDLLTPEYESDFQNINELKNADISVPKDNSNDVRLEMPSGSRYYDHLSTELMDTMKT